MQQQVTEQDTHNTESTSSSDLYQFLPSNLQAMASALPAAYTWLRSQNYDMQALQDSLFVNSNGCLDWHMPNGQGLFEPIPPSAYYRTWATPEKSEQSVTIIIGANLGYGINTILTTTHPAHKVVLIEPNPEMLIMCLGQTDYAENIRAGRLHIIPPSEQALADAVHRMDMHFLFGKISVREDIPSRQIGPEYAQWSAKCRARIENYSVEMTTLRNMQDTMVENELENFKRAITDGSLMKLKGAGKGLKAVSFGAGPSLGDHADSFAENKDNALYVTSLQAMPSVYKSGIKPHLCMAIDYSMGMSLVFNALDREWAKDIPLIYSTKIQPSVLAQYPGPTIPLWTLGGISTYLMNNDELVLDAGGNIGVTILRFLEWLEVEDVLLVGQDFAIRDGKTHSKGHHASAGSTNGYDVKTKDAQGSIIYTSPQLLAASRDMEEDIAKTEMRVFNLYGGGVPLRGTQHITIEQLQRDSHLQNDEQALHLFIDRLAVANRPTRRPVFESRSKEWSVSLRHIERKFEKLFKKVARNQKDINETLRQLEYFMRQDPLYAPYLFNEIMDVSGLARTRIRYVYKDLAEIRNILKRCLRKVRKMDNKLIEEAKVA